MENKLLKEKYFAPVADIIEIENEGVMAASVESMPNSSWTSMSNPGYDTQDIRLS